MQHHPVTGVLWNYKQSNQKKPQLLLLLLLGQLRGTA
jgi:hypothetical protein